MAAKDSRGIYAEDYDLQLSQRVHSQKMEYELCDKKEGSSDGGDIPRSKSAVSSPRVEGSIYRMGTFARIGSTKSSPRGENASRKGSGSEMINMDSHAPMVIYHV